MKSEFFFSSITYLHKIRNSFYVILSLFLAVFIFFISVQRSYPFENDLQIKSALLSSLFVFIFLGFCFYLSNYSTIENGYLKQYNPFLLRRRTIPLSQITNLKANLISTSKGIHKGMIVELNNGEQLKLISQINTKEELVELENVFSKLNAPFK